MKVGWIFFFHPQGPRSGSTLAHVNVTNIFQMDGSTNLAGNLKKREWKVA